MQRWFTLLVGLATICTWLFGDDLYKKLCGHDFFDPSISQLDCRRPALSQIGLTAVPSPSPQPVAASPFASGPGPSPSPSASPSPIPTQPRTGTVVLAEDFNNPSVAFLPRRIDGVPDDHLGYVDDEYMIRLSGTSPRNSGRVIIVPGWFSDSSIAINVRIVGDPRNQLVWLGCRRSEPGKYYAFHLRPSDGKVLMASSDQTLTQLSTWVESPITNRGNETNRLEYKCVDASLTGVVNGVTVLSVQDAKHKDGYMFIGAGTPDNVSGDAHARFDDLILRRE